MPSTPAFDHAWVDRVCAECDPIFDAADVGFVRQVMWEGEGTHRVVSSLLWEADPPRFAARYPDSGVVESYGEEQWPGVHCLDYWVNVDAQQRRVELSVEGWNLPTILLQVRGDGTWDGPEIADVFARILGVRSPRT